MKKPTYAPRPKARPMAPATSPKAKPLAPATSPRPKKRP